MRFASRALLTLALLAPTATAMAQTPPAPTADSARRRPARGLPLEVAREWNLDTREGSWMSVDVSPDGKSLVFDLVGDLYLMPFAGGDATALTSGMPFDGQPRFSPDGKSVVYVSDEDGGDNLWVIDVATKEKKQLTRGKFNRYLSPEWTPDGSYIVASKGGYRGGLPKLWLYHRDGGGGVQLMETPPNPAPGTGTMQLGAAFGPRSTCTSPSGTGRGTTTRSSRSISSIGTIARAVAARRSPSATAPGCAPRSRPMASGSCMARVSRTKRDSCDAT